MSPNQMRSPGGLDIMAKKKVHQNVRNLGDLKDLNPTALNTINFKLSLDNKPKKSSFFTEKNQVSELLRSYKMKDKRMQKEMKKMNPFN
mmetsp:Transcript_42267/g.64804  ORF Transcript_42267/g.64804 Transcript_42267/m.64804 type:complete len:89 (+) Transcript_42267:1330-1596(+)